MSERATSVLEGLGSVTPEQGAGFIAAFKLLNQEKATSVLMGLSDAATEETTYEKTITKLIQKFKSLDEKEATSVLTALGSVTSDQVAGFIETLVHVKITDEVLKALASVKKEQQTEFIKYLGSGSLMPKQKRDFIQHLGSDLLTLDQKKIFIQYLNSDDQRAVSNVLKALGSVTLEQAVRFIKAFESLNPKIATGVLEVLGSESVEPKDRDNFIKIIAHLSKFTNTDSNVLKALGSVTSEQAVRFIKAFESLNPKIATGVLEVLGSESVEPKDRDNFIKIIAYLSKFTNTDNKKTMQRILTHPKAALARMQEQKIFAVIIQKIASIVSRIHPLLKTGLVHRGKMQALLTKVNGQVETADSKLKKGGDLAQTAQPSPPRPGGTPQSLIK